MGKYGKKNQIDLSPLAYQICLCGIGGIGKTTIAKEICEKLVGDEGYIHFNIGREGGVSAIANIVSEDIENWQKVVDVVEDIIENKETDYPKLKVVIWDSLDELIRIGEAETIRVHNKTADKKATSILQCMGGFGKGQDYCINMILDKMWELKNVGVQSFIIAHSKKSDLIDPVSQVTYSQLTADAQQRYFNAVRNKMDIIAMAYIDREISKENTGRKNIVTKEEITVNKVSSEARVITFRDDSFSVDSKSRFANIVDRIPFDADAFIEAIQDAIKAEEENKGISMTEAKKNQTEKDKKKAKEAAEYSKAVKDSKIDEDRNTELVEQIKTNFKSIDSEEKKESVKAMMEKLDAHKFSELLDKPTKALEEILAAME